MTTILKRPKNDEVPNPENLKKGIKFGEGQDPTKGGAPKGKRVTTILKEILGKDSTEIGIDNLPEGMDGNKALALELLTIAFSKKSRDNDKLSAIKEILDRLEGKPTQSVEQTIKGSVPIEAWLDDKSS